jgi:multidrug efflux pump subunit AcrB
LIPDILPTLPPNVEITPHADQSIFVRAAISGVVREAAIAACLTALMILLFLGSWRSTIIIAVSIPLAILTSLTVLGALGETINIMTLGGLALAVGILVDDATVEVENINRNAAMGKEIITAILDGARQIATPAFVATLAICIVFVPMFFLSGVARYLFVPLAEAVVFAMLASYLLSRTLVPTLARYLLRGHTASTGTGPLTRFQHRFERGFDRLRGRYRGVLAWCVKHRALFLLACAGFFAASLIALVPWLGRNFFPDVDSGQFQLHMRARTGTRIEETARLADEVEQFIRAQLPPGEVAGIIDNIGVPYSGINLVYSASQPIGPGDAIMLVSLARGHRPTEDYVRGLRIALPRRFPGAEFMFEPADIVSQILNFGLPAPIDLQITGPDEAGNRRVAAQLIEDLARVPGLVDLRLHQPANRQVLDVTVDRTKASQVGMTMRDVATSVLTSLSGSFQTQPTFWLNTQTHVSYQITSQTPQYRIASLQDLDNVPVTSPGTTPQILANLATITRSANTPVVSHYDVQPVLDILGSVQGRDLGAVAGDVADVVEAARAHLPRGTKLITRGQIQTMNRSYEGLFAGLAGAILLIYLLMVVNFQSWLGPFIILTGLPAALAGIAWLLFITETPLSVPALMGTIMAMGVATSNSILVVTFANDAVAEGKERHAAAIEAGFTRFRPVIMTALAMIIGMLPMALGLGEGGEQNAPLGRAVIGGLLLATLSSLLFVPTMFSVLARRAPHAG